MSAGGAGQGAPPPRLLDPTRPPVVLTTACWLAIASLAIAGLVALISITSAITFHTAISNLGTLSEGPNPDSAHSTFQGWVLGSSLVGLLCAGLFLTWFYLAYSNLPKLGLGRLRLSSGWAIGAWFVPFLNLIRPKQIADDLWWATDGEADLSVGAEPKTSPLLNWWWGTLLAGWLLTGIGAGLALSGYDRAVKQRFLDVISASEASNAYKSALTEIEVGTILDALGALSLVAAAVLAIALVWQLTQRLEICRRAAFPESSFASPAPRAGPGGDAPMQANIPDPVPADRAPAGRSHKHCPDCAESVLAEARVCRYCGYRFDDEPTS